MSKFPEPCYCKVVPVVGEVPREAVRLPRDVADRARSLTVDDARRQLGLL